MVKRRMALVVTGVFLVLALLNVPGRVSNTFRSALAQVLSPLVSIEYRSLSGAGSVRTALATRRRLALENRELKKKVEELARQNVLLGELKSENDRLRRLLDFAESSDLSYIPARVVGRDTRNWFSSIVMNRGTRDGVEEGMAVVTGDGVVGKVVEAGPSLSTALLIVDKRSRVGGLIQRTREMGILEGTSFNTCLLRYLPRQTEARPGDTVVTSGLGGVYPKGLYVGKVSRIHEGELGLYRYADVSPGVNFAKLEEVLILAGRRGKGGEVLR